MTDLSQYAQLAQAAYAQQLSKNITGTNYKARLTNQETAHFSDVQANAFVENWKVLDQFDDGSGASVTLFQNIAGECCVAMRGTEPTDTRDWLTDYQVATAAFTNAIPQVNAVKECLAQWDAEGLLPATFSLAGHSLGGYLAALAAQDYSSRVTSLNMFNAPGLGGLLWGNFCYVAEGVVGETLPIKGPVNNVVWACPNFCVNGFQVRAGRCGRRTRW